MTPLCSVQGWHTAVKPVFEVLSLERKASGASVPLPKTVIRYILSAVLPRVLQRKLMGLLPQELGQYLLDSGQGGRLAGLTLEPPLLHHTHILTLHVLVSYLLHPEHLKVLQQRMRPVKTTSTDNIPACAMSTSCSASMMSYVICCDMCAVSALPRTLLYLWY